MRDIGRQCGMPHPVRANTDGPTGNWGLRRMVGWRPFPHAQEVDTMRWKRIGIAAGIGALGCIAAVVGAATLLHSDDGLHVLAGVFYGVPAACLLAAFIAGSLAQSHPTLDGLFAAELAWAVASLALAALVAAPILAVSLFILSQFFLVPIWAVGLFGGWAGGALARAVPHPRAADR